MSRPTESSSAAGQPAEAVSGAEWNQIRDALRGLKYGTVSIVVQDGVIVQIDRLEKRRIRRTESRNGAVSAQGMQ